MSTAVIRVPTTEVARHFGDYLARVRFGRDTIIVMKNDKAVAEIRAIPGTECTLGGLLELWRNATQDPDFATDLEAIDRADRPLENPWA